MTGNHVLYIRQTTMISKLYDPEYRAQVIESALDAASVVYDRGEFDKVALYVDFVRSLGATNEQVERCSSERE